MVQVLNFNQSNLTLNFWNFSGFAVLLAQAQLIELKRVFAVLLAQAQLIELKQVFQDEECPCPLSLKKF